jgi:hypothetical protein
MDSSSAGGSASTATAPVERFKPSNGFILGYLCLAVLAFVVVDMAVAEHSLTGLRVALGAVFAGAVVWISQVRPRATAYADRLRLRNSLHDIYVPYTLIDAVTIRQVLTVWVGERRYVCIGIGLSRRDRRPKRSERPSLLGQSRIHEFSAMAERASLDERAMNYETWVERRIDELVETAKRERRGQPAGEVQLAWATWELVVLAVSGVAFVATLFY